MAGWPAEVVEVAPVPEICPRCGWNLAAAEGFCLDCRVPADDEPLEEAE